MKSKNKQSKRRRGSSSTQKLQQSYDSSTQSVFGKPLSDALLALAAALEADPPEEQLADVIGAVTHSPHVATPQHSVLHMLVDGLFSRILCQNALSSFKRKRVPEESGQKSCYEVCFDLSIVVLTLMVSDFNANAQAESLVKPKQALYAAAATTIANSFGKHLVSHQKRTQPGARNSICLQSVLAFSAILEHEPSIAKVCKEKAQTLWSILQDVLPALFTQSEGVSAPHNNLAKQPRINLNEVILKQGQQQQFAQETKTGGGQVPPNGGTLDSLKSRGSNAGQSWSPKRATGEESARPGGKKRGHSIGSAVGNRTINLNLRANLEKVPDFQRAEEEAPDQLKEVNCEGNTIDNKSQTDEHPSLPLTKSTEKVNRVPPISMNQIQKHKTELPQAVTTLSTYMNMPHGQQQLNNTLRSGTHKQQAYQHNALATRSRLTRRQMSLSRQISTTGHSPIARHASISGGNEAQAAAQLSYADNQVDIPQQQQDSSTRNPKVPLLNMNKVLNTDGRDVLIDTVLSGQPKNMKATYTMPYAHGNMNAAWLSRDRSPSGLSHIAKSGTRSPSFQRIHQLKELESMYGEDVNGSFLFDQAQDTHKHPQHTAENKLKNLAVQLGEACLMTDLAALMTQKRDHELAESARKIVKQPRSGWPITKTKKDIPMRSFSVNNMPLTPATALLRPEISITDVKKQTLQDHVVEKKALKASIRQTDSLRYRVALLNIIYKLICEYSVEEARFLRLPVALFACFLGSSSFRQQRDAKLLKELKSGFKLKELYLCNTKDPQHEDFDLFKMAVIDGQIEQLHKEQAPEGPQQKLAFEVSKRIDLAQHQTHFSKVVLLPEITLVFRLLNKLSSVNEDTLQSQMLNDLANFTNRDQIIDVKQAHGQPLSGNRLTIGRGGSPSKMQAPLSPEKEEPILDSLKNPRFWVANCGIVYEVPPLGTTTVAGKHSLTQAVSRRAIRSKLDLVLHTLSRRIRFVLGQQFDPVSFEFADSLIGEITAMSAYMKEQKSRTLLNQFIDVALQTILMVKKTLIDIALQSSIFVTDFSQHWDAYEFLVSAKDSIAAATEHDEFQQAFMRAQQRHRELFAEFLNLVSVLLRQPKTSMDTLRLFTDVFVSDELWLQSIKAFTVSLFLSDLVSPLLSKNLNHFSLRQLEDLRHVKLVNFEEKKFMETVGATGDREVIKKAHNSLMRTMLCSLSTLRYFKSIARLFNQVVKVYFMEPPQPEQQDLPLQPYEDNIQNTSEMHSFNSFFNGPEKQSRFQNQGGIRSGGQNVKTEVPNAEFAEQLKEQKNRLYWESVIRYVLQKLEFLLTQKYSGLLIQYLQNNSVNHHIQGDLMHEDSCTPMNLQITKSVLSLLKGLFALPNSLTKDTLTESLMPFYIRTHYISFVKLYYKNFMYHQQEQHLSQEEAEQKMTFRNASLSLCKKHLECLFAIACTRNEATRRKLFQFKVVDFILQEIGLEFELQQRRELFLKLSKQEHERMNEKKNFVPSVQPGAVIEEEPVPEPMSDHILSPGMSSYTDTEIAPPSVITRKAPFIPSLKVGGLGMSTLIKENGKTQEELDVEKLVLENKNAPPKQMPPPPPTEQKKPFIPSLKVGGLGFSTLIKDNGKTQEEQDVEKLVLESKQAAKKVQPHPTYIPPVEQKKPFIPSLKVGGLGFSTLIKDNGKTQEEQDVEKLVLESKQKKVQPPPTQLPSSTQSEYHTQGPTNENTQEIKPTSTKKMPFMPPLKVGGLGFSTLIKDNGQTQEEQDVQKLVLESKQASKKPAIPSLKVAGLGMSTLIKDTDPYGKTKEELDVESVLAENKFDTKKASCITDFQVAERESERTVKKINEGKMNNDGGDSESAGSCSSDEYYAELQRIKEQKQAQSKPKVPMLGFKMPVTEIQKGVPQLAIGGLGMSSLLQDNQKKTQEELDVEQLIAKKKPVVELQKQNDPESRNQPNQTPQQIFFKKNIPAHASGLESKTPLPNSKIKIKEVCTTNTKGPTIFSLDLGQANNNLASRAYQQNVTTAQNRNLHDTEIKINRMPKSVLDQYVNQSTNTHNRRPLPEHPENEGEIDLKEGYAHFFNRGTASPDNVISGFAQSSQFSSITGNLKQGRMNLGTIGTSKRGDVSPIDSEFKKTLDFRSPTAIENTRNQGQLILGGNLVQQKTTESYPADEDQVNALHSPPVMFTKGGDADLSVGNIKLKKPSQNAWANITAKINQINEQQQQKRNDSQKKYGDTSHRSTSEAPSVPQSSSKKVRMTQKDPDLLQKIFRAKQRQQMRSIWMKKEQEAQRQASEQKSTENPAILSQRQSARLLDITEQDFYMRERLSRPIYLDEELHVLMLSLMMCLLLKPERGTLDELYCSQFPIDNENQNVLYLLHFHLSHMKNQSYVPTLMKKIEQVSPPLAGLRLLKLLCPSLFDLSLYGKQQDWKKLAAGAYGVVYECKTQFAEPQYVAIKQMQLPKSIYDRSVLHDIFTEITCLEEFRLEPSVTDLFDYGVDGTNYYIVMKRYSGSLREWRLKQDSSALNENLSLYLAIFYEILKCFKTIHNHKVTHYDIKCDNILIDFRADKHKNSAQQTDSEEASASSDTEILHADLQANLKDDFRITVGDFGECWMYAGDQDEFCSKNRGTEFTKSPEMLQLAINTRKDTDRYDRRKRTGTNSLSDVWSLGCLFFELLTGDYLFETEEYIEFHMRLTQSNMELFVQEKLAQIQNNVYLVDFLKFVLVRDMRLRPSLEIVLQRFELVYRLLASKTTGGQVNARFGAQLSPSDAHLGTGRNSKKVSLLTLLEKTAAFMINDGPIQFSADKMSRADDEYLNVSDSFPMVEQTDEGRAKFANMPAFMKIMEDIFLAQSRWLVRNIGRAVQMGITHVIAPQQLVTQAVRDQFDVFAIGAQDGPENQKMNPFFLMPAIMDYLRKVALFKGRVLFLEWNTVTRRKNSELVRECMVLSLAAIYQTTAYETYTLIKSQNLFFSISSQRQIAFSRWTRLNSKVQGYLADLPRFSCICGLCLIVLKRQFATYQFLQIVTCSCSQYYRNVEGSLCPSSGCHEFITFLKTYYPKKAPSLLVEDKLHWGVLEEDDFVLGPNFSGETSNFEQRQVAANLSKTIDKNCTLVSITEKNRGDMSGRSGHSASQQPRRFGQNASQLGHANGPNLQNTNLQRWKVYKCKECQVWTHAVNEHEQRYALLLNNAVRTKKQQKLGLLTGLDDATAQASGGGVRVPNLEKIKLRLPF